MRFPILLKYITRNPKGHCQKLPKALWSSIPILKVATSLQPSRSRRMSMILWWATTSTQQATTNGSTSQSRAWLSIRITSSMSSISPKMIPCSTMAWLRSSTPWLRTKESLEWTEAGGGRAKRFPTKRVTLIDKTQGGFTTSWASSFPQCSITTKYILLILTLIPPKS